MSSISIDTRAFAPDVVETIGDDVAASGMTRELPPAIRGVRVRLTAIQVVDGLQGVLGIGKASGVYVISSVADGLGTAPLAFTGRPYRGINNGEMLPIGQETDPGGVFNVYLREAPIPRSLALAILVLRSNADLRDIGAAIGTLQADARYKAIAGSVQAAITAANPIYGLVTEAAQQGVELLAGLLGGKQDDQLGYYAATYTNLFDDLGVGAHPQGGGTMVVGKVRLSYQIDAM